MVGRFENSLGVPFSFDTGVPFSTLYDRFYRESLNLISSSMNLMSSSMNLISVSYKRVKKASSILVHDVLVISPWILLLTTASIFLFIYSVSHGLRALPSLDALVPPDHDEVQIALKQLKIWHTESNKELEDLEENPTFMPTPSSRWPLLTKENFYRGRAVEYLLHPATLLDAFRFVTEENHQKHYTQFMNLPHHERKEVLLLNRNIVNSSSGRSDNNIVSGSDNNIVVNGSDGNSDATAPQRSGSIGKLYDQGGNHSPELHGDSYTTPQQIHFRFLPVVFGLQGLAYTWQKSIVGDIKRWIMAKLLMPTPVSDYKQADSGFIFDTVMKNMLGARWAENSSETVSKKATTKTGSKAETKVGTSKAETAYSSETVKERESTAYSSETVKEGESTNTPGRGDSTPTDDSKSKKELGMLERIVERINSDGNQDDRTFKNGTFNKDIEVFYEYSCYQDPTIVAFDISTQHSNDNSNENKKTFEGCDNFMYVIYIVTYGELEMPYFTTSSSNTVTSSTVTATAPKSDINPPDYYGCNQGRNQGPCGGSRKIWIPISVHSFISFRGTGSLSDAKSDVYSIFHKESFYSTKHLLLGDDIPSEEDLLVDNGSDNTGDAADGDKNRDEEFNEKSDRKNEKSDRENEKSDRKNEKSDRKNEKSDRKNEWKNRDSHREDVEKCSSMGPAKLTSSKFSRRTSKNTDLGFDLVDDLSPATRGVLKERGGRYRTPCLIAGFAKRLDTLLTHPVDTHSSGTGLRDKDGKMERFLDVIRRRLIAVQRVVEEVRQKVAEAKKEVAHYQDIAAHRDIQAKSEVEDIIQETQETQMQRENAYNKRQSISRESIQMMNSHNKEGEEKLQITIPPEYYMPQFAISDQETGSVLSTDGNDKSSTGNNGNDKSSTGNKRNGIKQESFADGVGNWYTRSLNPLPQELEFKYFFTGHSLGGVMAQLTSIYVKGMQQKKRWPYRRDTYNYSKNNEGNRREKRSNDIVLVTIGSPQIGNFALCKRVWDLKRGADVAFFVFNRYDIAGNLERNPLTANYSLEHSMKDFGRWEATMKKSSMKDFIIKGEESQESISVPAKLPYFFLDLSQTDDVCRSKHESKHKDASKESRNSTINSSNYDGNGSLVVSTTTSSRNLVGDPTKFSTITSSSESSSESSSGQNLSTFDMILKNLIFNTFTKSTIINTLRNNKFVKHIIGLVNVVEKTLEKLLDPLDMVLPNSIKTVTRRLISLISRPTRLLALALKSILEGGKRQVMLKIGNFEFLGGFEDKFNELEDYLSDWKKSLEVKCIKERHMLFNLFLGASADENIPERMTLFNGNVILHILHNSHVTYEYSDKTLLQIAIEKGILNFRYNKAKGETNSKNNSSMDDNKEKGSETAKKEVSVSNKEISAIIEGFKAITGTINGTISGKKELKAMSTAMSSNTSRSDDISTVDNKNTLTGSQNNNTALDNTVLDTGLRMSGFADDVIGNNKLGDVIGKKELQDVMHGEENQVLHEGDNGHGNDDDDEMFSKGKVIMVRNKTEGKPKVKRGFLRKGHRPL